MNCTYFYNRMLFYFRFAGPYDPNPFYDPNTPPISSQNFIKCHIYSMAIEDREHPSVVGVEADVGCIGGRAEVDGE